MIGGIEPYRHPWSADVYDAVYARLRDYAGDVEKLVAFVQRETGGAETVDMHLLDVACGTGRHLQLLAPHFASVTGIDDSPVQLAAAERRLAGAASLHLADMRALGAAVGEGATFDVVTCLFSSIACLATSEELRSTITQMAEVLRPGGVVLIEPWLKPSTFRISPIVSYVVDEPELKVSRMALPRLEDDVTVLEMHHLVARPDGIVHYVETHRSTMFTDEDFESAFAAAGLTPRFDAAGLDDVGRGLWCATRGT
jgi:SAM-dependent methyltransferase